MKLKLVKPVHGAAKPKVGKLFVYECDGHRAFEVHRKYIKKISTAPSIKNWNRRNSIEKASWRAMAWEIKNR